jgi:TetR/AcrR family transcriptional regulator, cholesterol catabolism regulator
MTTQTRSAASGATVHDMPGWQLARRERIVQAAMTALEQQEYEQIQIRDVAQAAGVALGTVYRYFSSKEHLYAAVLHAWAEPGRRPLRRAAQLTAEQRVRARMRAVVSAFERQPQFFKVQVLLQGSTDDNARKLMAAFVVAAQELLVADLAPLGKEAEDAATMLWAMLNTMLTVGIYHGRSMREVYRIADKFIDLLVPALDAAAAG